MRKSFGILLALALAVALALPPAAWSAEDKAPEPAYEGYLVGCSAPPESGARLLFRAAAALEPVLEGVYWTESESYARYLLESGQADFIEPNYVATLFDLDAGAGGGGGWPREALCADFAGSLGLDGTGVRVALIDSGVDLNNPDLTQANILAGYDYVNETTAMADADCHGTLVAQLICGDDNGLGVTGIARGCELVPLRCFAGSRAGTVAELALAVREAVTRYNCDVINMSWGLTNDSLTLHRAVADARNAGAVLVAAAGNTDAFAQGSVVYPAAYDEVISVAALNETLAASPYSIQNAYVSVCAPGDAIGFVDARGTAVSGSGTSFAAPCVSAVAALVKQYAGVSGADCLALLCERAADLGAAGFDRACGYGLPRLDLVLQQRRCELAEGTLSASLLRGAGGRVVLAAYDAQGRLSAVRSASAADGYGAASCALPEGTARCAAFFLDEAGAPLGEAVRYDAS